MKIEDLNGIPGRFEGRVVAHPNPKLHMRALAVGEMTYVRTIDRNTVTISVKGNLVHRIHGDNRRFVRIEKGPKSNRDKIIGIIDS